MPIYRVTMILVLSLLIVSSALFASTAWARPILDTEPDVAREESASPDSIILAREAGLPVESVERSIAFQQAFGKYADELLVRFPDQISAVWMESVPNTRGHVQFTGEVPPAVASEIESQGLLDPNNVVLTGGGMISMADHMRRAELAAEAMVELGHQNFITFFDFIDKVIRVEFQRPEGASQPSKLDLVGALQNRVRAEQELQGRAATVDVLDLELTVITGSGPIFTSHHSRGGNQLLDDGVDKCTSGWSVSGPNGDGIINAGHCTGLNEFEQPGVTPYSMTFRDQEWGAGGDVEYHTTVHAELAEFYADATSIRGVVAIKPTNTMVGGNVCFYGRASNVRTCQHEVEEVGVSIFDPSCPCTIGNLARTDTSSSVDGDSGGGWSHDFTAWGVNSGKDQFGKGYFTPVEEAQDALNVTIKLK